MIEMVRGKFTLASPFRLSTTHDPARVERGLWRDTWQARPRDATEGRGAENGGSRATCPIARCSTFPTPPSRS